MVLRLFFIHEMLLHCFHCRSPFAGTFTGNDGLSFLYNALSTTLRPSVAAVFL